MDSVHGTLGKKSYMSGVEIRNNMTTDDSDKPKNSYIVAQAAHKVCKKDHHEILSDTVSYDLCCLQNIAGIFLGICKRTWRKMGEVILYSGQCIQLLH
jgi:hypothetical protein